MLHVRGLARRFGRREVFAGLDLDLLAGSRLLVTGPNGSGKTTLLRCLAGTLTATAGTASIAGRAAGSVAARRLTAVCLAPEQALYGRLSGHENLRLAAGIRLPRPARAGAVARLEREFEVASYAARPAERCSAGMRTRISLARALVGEPALLLLDEPTRSLDERGRDLLWAALDARPDLACVIASHLDADRCRCHRVLTLPVPG